MAGVIPFDPLPVYISSRLSSPLRRCKPLRLDGRIGRFRMSDVERIEQEGCGD